MTNEPRWQVVETADTSWPSPFHPPPNGYRSAGEWEPIGARSGGRVGVMWRRPVRFDLQAEKVTP